jgi:hypothetical protein
VTERERGKPLLQPLGRNLPFVTGLVTDSYAWRGNLAVFVNSLHTLSIL